ncbi:hypothetical protein GBA63_19170 [Rubrobacter tropicus]|uniref:Uncharacterized protein n=1 Tax=Rubrobacter tropicus TaxID=2653851 RepID=A0A6G8QDL6_9ACTN|nr:hypothetical protein [Rubrobacter tropicus]QIN84528.1 hypothetical protein GBA63_19170 [Rubrobacter tropicus]
MKSTIGPEWLPYELRQLGKVGLAMPIFVALGFVGIAVAMALTGTGTEQIARRLTSGLEIALPFVAGLAAAFVVADEPALDLQLTVLTRYRTTVLRRLALIVGWTALVAILWAVALRLLGLWAWPEPFLLMQLGWLSPLLWYVSFGVLLALLLRSRMASGAVLGGIWVFQYVLGGALGFNYWTSLLLSLSTTTYQLPFFGIEQWLYNRLVLIATALLMTLGAALILRNNETLVRGGDG